MRATAPEQLFASRDDFRTWLRDNAEINEGVWLVFSKTEATATVSADEALEEALCFGWIDGQIRTIDDARYAKYFAPRRPKSQWSERNKMKVETLRARGLMTDRGERAVEDAKRSGMWEAPTRGSIADEEVEALAKKLFGISPAYENFVNMSRSVRLTYTKRFLSFKTEEARHRDFERIVDRLNKNLKPM
jgi:uncharacterized protein YdeI (YjbR/CyaY-like superfamily)